MKIKILITFLICLSFAVGCASPPKERMKLPSQIGEPEKPQPPAKEKLEELVIPQREEVKKVPEKLYSFFARDASVHDVLLAFSRESELNIVMDPGLSGKVTIDLKRVTLKEALDAILSPLGWTYSVDGKFIKISRAQMETRFFTLNYIATKRTGKREIYASTGGGLQTGALAGQQVTTGTGARTGYSDLVSVDEMDLWKEIQKGLEAIIFGSIDEKDPGSEKEKTTWSKVDAKGKKLIINKSTGVIMVTDYPANVHKVASFLEAIEGTSQRQVTIQAKILEVILSDEYREGINWKVIQGLPRSVNLAWGLTNRAGTTGYPGGTSGYLSVDSTGGSGATSISTPGVFKIKPYGGVLAVGAGGAEIVLSDIMAAISEQGDVKVLSSPTISTLNNQKAIIRVGNQDVFFITGAVSTQTTVTQIIQPMTIDVGIILDVTPQIAEDGTIIMNIHPSITEKTGEKATPDGKTTFPLLSVRETDTTVKVKDGQTIIIAGLMQEKKEESYVGLPVLQSVPLLGGLFRYKTEKKRNSELVIMITPTIQVGKKVEDLTNK
ncbi:MAG: secretin and TonB N-terminal domain-containing protein [Syntrophaceae bacterium]|nr:secretin and TonB N-terminal domain-containing protein [Syntrophaceae bacterium]